MIIVYLFSVTSVPVSFLHRLRAVSRRSGSSFKKFSSRTTLSISLASIARRLFCSPGNFSFKSATVLLSIEIAHFHSIYSRKCIEQYERIPTHLARLNTNAISSTAAILTRDRRLITSPRNPSTDDSKSLKSFSKRITSCL